ncbi:MAG: hypothetical protein QFX32_04370 [Methanolinea sp.]|nr:hypothetical protein [Methanolinea sp.]
MTLGDSGQLSLDFLVGISIFAIALILASTLISGLLIGLQAKQIDLDAVAYRTSVILVEDPGEPSTFASSLRIQEENQWEFIGHDQRDKVKRFGLSNYKSTPRILSEQKILSFFNKAPYPRANFQDLSEYRDRLIGGNYPYHFNISLKIENNNPLYCGEPFWQNSKYGYIKRIFLVKKQSVVGATVDMQNFVGSPPATTYQFIVSLPYNRLYDMRRSPQYWIEPTKEDITINLVKCEFIRNPDLPPDENIRIENIYMTFEGIYINGTRLSNYPLPYRDFYASIDGNTPVKFNYSHGVPDGPLNVMDSIKITFPAGYFIPPSAFADLTLIQMNVIFTFTPDSVNIDSLNNIYSFEPNSPGFSQPSLQYGVLEVRIW